MLARYAGRQKLVPFGHGGRDGRGAQPERADRRHAFPTTPARQSGVGAPAARLTHIRLRPASIAGGGGGAAFERAVDTSPPAESPDRRRRRQTAVAILALRLEGRAAPRSPPLYCLLVGGGRLPAVCVLSARKKAEMTRRAGRGNVGSGPREHRELVAGVRSGSGESGAGRGSIRSGPREHQERAAGAPRAAAARSQASPLPRSVQDSPDAVTTEARTTAPIRRHERLE